MHKRSAILLSAFLVFFVPAFATTLTFPNNICSAVAAGTGPMVACANYGFINQAYGDNATVDVQYHDLINGGSLKWWSTGYNTLPSAVWGGNGDNTGGSDDLIAILPTAGNAVTLNSFDAGAYFYTTRNTNIVVRDASTLAILWSFAGPVGNDNVAPSSFSPNVSSNNGITIEWYDSGYNVGLNNIAFDTQAAVPEPSTILLAAAGLLFTGYLRRRR